MLLEQGSVRQACQVVVKSKIAYPVFGLFQFRDILKNPDNNFLGSAS